MSKKLNGTNGKGPGDGEPEDGPEDDKVVEFPTLAERDRMRREERKQEEQWRKEYRAQQKSIHGPMINLDKIPLFSRVLISSMVIVHLILYLAVDLNTRGAAMHLFGFIPGRFTGTLDWSWIALITPVSYMLIHGGWMHVIFNGAMGMALSIFFERLFGARTTAIFFALCGVIGAATYFVLNPFGTHPVIGASGGISGLFAAVLMMLHEQNRFALRGPLAKYGAWSIIGIWAAIMLGIGLIGGGDLAWQAHIGGLLGGAVLYKGLRSGRLNF
jgi:membrane associated rhomboid family serine protease